jgi:hypothetical protein
VIGGVTADTNGQLNFAEDVEVFNPRTGEFRKVGSLSGGRAFHSTNLLRSFSWEGPFDVLILGGFSAKQGTAAAAVVLGTDKDLLPLLPGPDTEAAPGLVLRYYPWTEVVGPLKDSPKLLSRFFHSMIAFPDGQTAVAGGWSGYAGGKGVAATDLELLPQPRESVHEGPFPLVRARVGSMAAALSATKAVVFGGNLESTPEALLDEACETLEIQNNTVTAAPATIQTGSALSSLAFGALAFAGQLDNDPHLLLAGGLLIEKGHALKVNPAKTPYRVSEAQNSKVSVGTIEQGVPFTPVAFNASLALSLAGDVYLSGGCPTSCPGNAKLCGTPDVYHYSQGVLSKEAQLNFPRMGHVMTLLPGNLALISGGLDSNNGKITALSSVELLPLSDGGFALDPWSRNPAKLDTTQICPGD